MANSLSENLQSHLELLQQLANGFDESPNSLATSSDLTTLLEQLSRLVLDDTQRIRVGSNQIFSEAIARLWAITESNIKSDNINIEFACNLARLTRNASAGCSHNQNWITKACEPNIRNISHFLTSFYNSQNVDYHLLTMLLAQCLVNMCTGNETTSMFVWNSYKEFTEQQNIITRLLAYPEQKAISATLVFILNSLSSAKELSIPVAQTAGGRAVYVGLLEMADRIYEDEERVDQFHIVFQIFVNLFEAGGLSTLYASLQPPDGAISPHQITLLKLLDGYAQSTEHALNGSFGISDFLANGLLSHLQKANDWMVAPLDNGQPNENLPQIATVLVLVSQMLANYLMSEQLAWERSMNDDRKRPILEYLKSPERLCVELIVDALRHLDQLLPRIQFGKIKPQLPTSSPAELISPDVSGFQFVKRDLVRLLATLVHDDRDVQDRIREHKGVEVVLSLCAVDDRNPYIREHALFALRNLLYRNKENQDIVRQLEPMGRWDQNGVLTDLR